MSKTNKTVGTKSAINGAARRMAALRAELETCTTVAMRACVLESLILAAAEHGRLCAPAVAS